MVNKKPGYFERRRKVKLFQQWADRSGLPPEEIPPEMRNEQPMNETDLAPDGTVQDKASGYPAPISMNRKTVSIPLRFVLLGIFIIALLLVALSVIVTILIIR